MLKTMCQWKRTYKPSPGEEMSPAIFLGDFRGESRSVCTQIEPSESYLNQGTPRVAREKHRGKGRGPKLRCWRSRDLSHGPLDLANSSTGAWQLSHAPRSPISAAQRAPPLHHAAGARGRGRFGRRPLRGRRVIRLQLFVPPCSGITTPISSGSGGSRMSHKT
jgi:hypothetical protein